MEFGSRDWRGYCTAAARVARSVVLCRERDDRALDNARGHG